MHYLDQETLIFPIAIFTKNIDAAIMRTKDAPMNAFSYPKYAATIPEISGPVVWPISIIEPSTPIAEPWVSRLLKSEMKAEVAEVTMERLNPNNILNAIRGINDLKSEKLPMQIAPIITPIKI